MDTCLHDGCPLSDDGTSYSQRSDDGASDSTYDPGDPESEGDTTEDDTAEDDASSFEDSFRDDCSCVECLSIKFGVWIDAIALVERNGSKATRDEQMQNLRDALECEPTLVNSQSQFATTYTPPDTLFVVPTGQYQSVLERAVSHCDVEVVALLLAHGADPDKGVVDRPHGYGGLDWLCSQSEQCPNCIEQMRTWLRRHRTKSLFDTLRNAVRMRRIVIYWLKEAMEAACAPGGAGRMRDCIAFNEEFQGDA